MRSECDAEFLKQTGGLEGMLRSWLLHLAVLYAKAILLMQNRGRRVARQFVRALK